MFLLKTIQSTAQQLTTQLRTLRQDDCVLIYQMGKVGSTALERNLPHAIHFHTLYNNPHCPFRARLKWGWFGTKIILPLAYLVRRFVIRRNSKVRIITLVRHPIARARSVFFQELPYWLVLNANKRGLDERQEGSAVLREAFTQVFNIGYYDRWFDHELKRFTGVDIFDHEFDTTRGCTLLRNGKYEVLVVKYESLTNAQPHIEAFVGKELDLTHENVSSNKWYGPIMRDLQEEEIAAFPESRDLLESRTARFFGYAATNESDDQ